MALLQFMSAGIDKVAIPTTIHTDHLTMAEKGAKIDLAAAKIKHKEVFEFLASASAKYNIGFWKPGSGIIHTILFEKYTLSVFLKHLAWEQVLMIQSWRTTCWHGFAHSECGWDGNAGRWR